MENFIPAMRVSNKLVKPARLAWARDGGQVTEEEYERLDQLHYKVENELLKLIESLQKKQRNGKWEEDLQAK